MLGIGLGITSRLRSSVFNPASLFRNGEQGWLYDLSDMSTLFQDAAGITPVTAVNQPVGLCLDKSGRGNHRSQSASLPRPTYGRHPLSGIRNLLTFTEQFTGLTGAVVASSDGGVGGVDYSATLPVTSGNNYGASKAYTGEIGSRRTVSLFVNPNSNRYIYMTTNNVSEPNVGVLIRFDTSDLSFNVLRSVNVIYHSASIVPVESGLYRVSIEFTQSAGSSNKGVAVFCTNESIYTGTFVFLNFFTQNPESGFFAGGAQFEPGSTATPYQRVGSAFDVTEAGVPDLYYLSYDGLNDSLSTAPFAWGSDKATVVAGVRRLSPDRAALVGNGSSLNGVFEIQLNILSAQNIEFSSQGTIRRSREFTLTASPGSNVFTQISDISGDSLVGRLDGVQVLTVGGDQGTGDYGTYPVFFGARGGSQLFFNGREYSSFAINRLLTANELSQIERYTAQRTGITIASPFKAYALGDSTVAAFAGGTALMQLFDTGYTEIDLSVPGHTIAQQKTAWVNQTIVADETAWVIMQIGLNDLVPAEAASVAIARLQDLADTIKSEIGSKPLLIAQMIPCRQRLINVYGATDGPIAYQKWLDMNAAIAGLGPTPITGVQGRITEHVPLMDDGNGNLRAEFDTGDGIHPNNAGRQVNVTAWRNALGVLGL